jgi:hypothetical protein
VLQLFVSLVVIATLNLFSSYLQSLIFCLLLMVSLCEFGVDDCQGKVQQEECPDEHQWQKVDENAVHVCPLHHSLDVTPTFEGH